MKKYLQYNSAHSISPLLQPALSMPKGRGWERSHKTAAFPRHFRDIFKHKKLVVRNLKQNKNSLKNETFYNDFCLQAMANTLKLKNTTLALLIGLISLIVFLESSIPYIYAQHRAAPGNKFLGQIIYTPDQDMYFSFIRQARDGRFIFSNRLTCIPNKPAFVNLQFWLIGTLQRITASSENGIYYIWRYLGILLLTIGVTLIARILLPATWRLLACIIILMFTGGFGFIFAILNSAHLISLDTAHSGILDMRYGFLPFQQAMTNPNFSFPHGLILIAYAFYMLGEQKNKTFYYLLSGLFFFIIGLVRPYDIIPPFVIFPVYVLITSNGLKFNIRSMARKFSPLAFIIPVLIYNLWLFKFNDAFKDWSTQGLNAGSLPSALWHYLSYGIIGILAIIRLAQYKSNPISKNDKFLLVWFLSTFIIIQLGRYFPVIGFSPQIGVYLAVPLALLGCSIKYDIQKQKLLHYASVTVIIICVIVSNISILLYYTKNFSDPLKTPLFYANKNEVAAWEWLNNNIYPGDVVLAMPATSLQIAKYTNANVVAAHYSVTPRYNENAGIVNRIYADSLLGSNQKTILEKLNTRYIYIGPTEKDVNNIQIEPGNYLTLVYNNPLVSIYKVNQKI